MRRLIAVLGLSLLLAACATTQRYGAADDVHALLTAIRDDDAAMFEAYVDRPALQRELGSRIGRELVSRTEDDRLKLLGAILGPAAGRLAGDVLIQASTFRRVAEFYGYRASQPLPGRMAIASVLRHQADGQVCAPVERGGPCVLIFREADDRRWRLVGFEGDLGLLNRPR